MEEAAVAQLLPHIIEGLKGSAPAEYRLATYMIVMRLASLTTPAPQLRSGEANTTLLRVQMSQ